MTRWVLFGLTLAGALLVGAPQSRSGEKPKAAWKPITVAWHGQSFFTVTGSDGTTVAFDPHLIPEYGRPVGIKADIVLTSHNHVDHTQIQALENHKDKGFRVLHGLKGPGLRADWNPIDTTIKGVRIRSVPLYHDSMEGLKTGKNAGFVVEMDGWKICHLGDLGHLLTPAQLRRIGPVDVVMIPVGGIYTINGAEAKKVVDQLCAKKKVEYVFPMHCGTKVYDEVLPPTEFFEEFHRENVASSPDNKVRLNRDPSRPRPLVVQLHYWPKGAKQE